jgi:hypothetical protein
MRLVTVDLTRCKRCGKRPRGKMAQGNFERYAPFCTFHCKEWWNLEEAMRHIGTRQPDNGPAEPR